MHRKSFLKDAIPLVLTAVVVLLAPAAGGAHDYLAVVRAYAEAMIDPQRGRDHFGSQHTPLFATVLDRQTYEIPSGRVDDLYRARVPQEFKFVANPHMDQNLLQVLYALTALTGEPRYAAEADRTLEHFLKNCQEDRFGFYTWGEHVGWDLQDECLGGFPRETGQGAIHEFWRPWIYWEKSLELAPENCHRFARALWHHQIDHGGTSISWSRHAHLNSKVASRRGYEFPRHGGFYITAWAHAYRHTHDPVLREAMESVLNYFYEARNPHTGAIPHYSQMPEWLRTESNVSLAVSLWESAPLVPEPLADRMRALAREIDDIFLRLPHDPGPGGKGLVLTASTDDLQPIDLWFVGGPKFVRQPPEPEAVPRHKGYTEGWLSAYVGPVPHSTIAGYCIARHQQIETEGYRRLILLTAEGYLDSEPDLQPYRNGDATVTPRIDAGTVGRVIGVLNYAHRISGDEKYLRGAEWYADWAVERFWPESLPLPLPSVSAAAGQNYYSASSRCDTLVMNLLETWLLRHPTQHAIPLRWTDL